MCSSEQASPGSSRTTDVYVTAQRRSSPESYVSNRFHMQALWLSASLPWVLWASRLFPINVAAGAEAEIEEGHLRDALWTRFRRQGSAIYPVVDGLS